MPGRGGHSAGSEHRFQCFSQGIQSTLPLLTRRQRPGQEGQAGPQPPGARVLAGPSVVPGRPYRGPSVSSLASSTSTWAVGPSRPAGYSSSGWHPAASQAPPERLGNACPLLRLIYGGIVCPTSPGDHRCASSFWMCLGCMYLFPSTLRECTDTSGFLTSIANTLRPGAPRPAP